MPEVVVRKFVTRVEEILHEGGPRAESPPLRGVIAAVVVNPYAGKYVEDIVGFMEDLKPLGLMLTDRLIAALGDRAGIRRYGHCTLPMDETLVTTALDLGGRCHVVYQAPIPAPKMGDFDSELVEDFWQAVAGNALCNLHVVLHHGRNSHHIAEAVFKSAARALRMAVELDPRQTGVPSTKGVL